MNIWECKIGENCEVPAGGDYPMRLAVAEAYAKLTGEQPDFVFSGWGAKLDENQRAVIEKINPIPQEIK